MTDRNIYIDLLTGTRCVCTSTKKRGMSLCAGCYGRLPIGVKHALYDRDGNYPDAYRRALTVLGLPEPVAQPPDRGPSPVAAQPFESTHK